MESHIFLGCWNCFFCGKGPWEFDLAVRSTPCACCAEPGSSSASAAPLRRCCWRQRWGLCLGAAASGWEVDGRNLQSQKPWEFAANALWKCERIVETPFFFKLSCSTSGVYSPWKWTERTFMKASKMIFLCKWVKYEISVSSRSFFGGAPSLKLTTIAPANWMVGKMKNMFAFRA